MIPNIIANFTKTKIYICIGVTQHLAANTFQIGITLRVLFLMRPLVMLRTVQFNNDFGRRNIEIHNIIPKNFLTVNRYGQLFQTVIP